MPKEKKIRVNVIAPGPIWTPLIPSTFSANEVATFGSDTPLGWAGRSRDLFCISRFGRFLLHNRSSAPSEWRSRCERIVRAGLAFRASRDVYIRVRVATMQRSDGRALNQIRSINFELNIAPHASGSVLVAMGNTRVICGVTIEEIVPRWMKDQGVTGGWLTAEYSMLPYSTTTRKQRDIAKGRLDGRSSEIQRLIGRSLRSVIDLEKLGPRTMWIDCDVLQADGGTRTAAITGASLAVTVACKKLLEEKKIASSPMRKLIAAVSAGIVDGNAMVDLNYEEDKAAAVDLNLVATEDGEFVEIQGSGEEATFTQGQLGEMLAFGHKGIRDLIAAQQNTIALLTVTAPT
jgi:ribonuclease PH